MNRFLFHFQPQIFPKSRPSLNVFSHPKMEESLLIENKFKECLTLIVRDFSKNIGKIKFIFIKVVN